MIKKSDKGCTKIDVYTGNTDLETLIIIQYVIKHPVKEWSGYYNEFYFYQNSLLNIRTIPTS